MELALKAAAAGIVAVTGALLIKKHNPEQSSLLLILGAAVILVAALGLVEGIFEIVSMAQAMSGMSPAVIAPVLKCVAIGIIARVGADACKDAGSAGVASAVELAAALAALFAALPLMKTFLNMMEALL